MALTAVLSTDLMFGSKLQAIAEAAGQPAKLYQSCSQVDGSLGELELLLLDAVSVGTGTEVTKYLERWSSQLKIVAAYSHVDADAKAALDTAGCSRVVPRSKMMREGVQIVEELLNDRSKN